MIEILRGLLTILLLLLPAAAQTRAELDSKYGKPEGNIYKIKPGIAAAVTFADDGKVKEFRIISDDPEHNNKLLKIDDVRAVLRELAPGRLCHRPESFTQVESQCPPRNGCKGFQEVWRRATTLMVSYKDDIAYAVIALDNTADPPPGHMTLLPGYENIRECGIDTLAGYIEKVGGIKIDYDIGTMAGNDAQRHANSGNVEWTRTEKANGDSVLIVLTKQNRIIATFEKANAKFFAQIGSQLDIDDFMKMVLTFHPH